MADFSVTVLITRQEYAAFAAAAVKKRGVSPSFIAGVLWLLVGFALVLMEQAAAAWLGCMVAGAVLCLWDGVIAPQVAASLAAREYDSVYGGRMAQTLVFSEASVRVSTPRAEGVLPLAAVSRVVVSKTGVQLDFGRELSLFIPERSVTPAQLQALCHWGRA